MWLDKKEDWNSGPPKRVVDLGYIDDLKRLHPDFEYKFWNFGMVSCSFPELIVQVKRMFDVEPRLQPYKKFFYNLKRHIERCDFGRYAVLWIYGGIYMDLDFKPLKNFEPLLQGIKLSFRVLKFLGREMGFCYENIWNCQIYKLIGTMSPVFNGVLLSSKDHPFWKDWLDFLIKNYRENKIVLSTTGPGAFGKFIRKKGYKHTNPEWFIDRKLIIPFSVFTTKKKQARFKAQLSKVSETGSFPADASNKLKNAYTVTFWKEGSGWMAQDQSMFWYGIVIMLVVIVELAAYIIPTVFFATARKHKKLKMEEKKNPIYLYDKTS